MTFEITGSELTFLIGGGNHPIGDPAGACAVTLVIRDVVVRSVTGKDTETMERVAWDVSDYMGQAAQLRIVDENSGDWGHINCDDFQMFDASGHEIPFTLIEAASV